MVCISWLWSPDWGLRFHRTVPWSCVILGPALRPQLSAPLPHDMSSLSDVSPSPSAAACSPSATTPPLHIWGADASLFVPFPPVSIYCLLFVPGLVFHLLFFLDEHQIFLLLLHLCSLPLPSLPPPFTPSSLSLPNWLSLPFPSKTGSFTFSLDCLNKQEKWTFTLIFCPGRTQAVASVKLG